MRCGPSPTELGSEGIEDKSQVATRLYFMEVVREAKGDK